MCFETEIDPVYRIVMNVNADHEKPICQQSTSLKDCELGMWLHSPLAASIAVFTLTISAYLKHH